MNNVNSFPALTFLVPAPFPTILLAKLFVTNKMGSIDTFGKISLTKEIQ